ncbi:MAG: methyltransferase domain-containing protein [Labilithrix sp.]|nr:methyltransferase domain-containing protein [Labilithrix sp.]
MSRPRRHELLRRLASVLVCPKCRTAIEDGAEAPGPIVCRRCGATASRSADAFEFGGLTEAEEQEDWLNDVKARAKRRLGRLYPLALEALGPVYGDSGITRFLAGFDLDRELVCDLGAGTRSYDDKVVCVDGYGYQTVHLRTDLTSLPFADGSISGVLSEAVLEHVPDPAKHVDEIFRVLKPGGRVHCYFPFIAGFHASPHDYTRLTLPGLRRLFHRFDVDSTIVAGGPTSGLVWTLQEWLAIAGSFGSERLYRALVPVTWVLSPLKYLDALLIRHPAAHVIASGFALEATKPLGAAPASVEARVHAPESA